MRNRASKRQQVTMLYKAPQELMQIRVDDEEKETRRR